MRRIDRIAGMAIVLALMISAAQAQDAGRLTLEISDCNYNIGDKSIFYQHEGVNLVSTGLLPFDPGAGSWDFSAFATGTTAEVELLDPTSSPGNTHFPGADGCTKNKLAGTDPGYTYEYFTPTSMMIMGLYMKTLGFITVVADFQPDSEAFRFPMQVGTTWSETIHYSYEILGVTVNVTENYTTEVVAEGKLKSPDIGYWMPCLVTRSYGDYQDNLGMTENFWSYNWVVPNGFTGANGVVSLMSNKDDTQNFTNCRYALVLGPTNITPNSYVEDLFVDASTISRSAGGTLNFLLDAPVSYGGREYFLLGSASGTSPGTQLPGGATLPLNRDPVMDFILKKYNTPALQNFRGLLDVNGQAQAVLGAQQVPLPAGTTLSFGYTTENPYDYQSSTVDVEVVP